MTKKVIITGNATFGPFKTVEVRKDHIEADGVILSLDLLNNPKIVDEADAPPAVLSAQQYLTEAYAYLDRIAREEGYRDLADGISFVNSLEQNFAVEGMAFLNLRDEVVQLTLVAIAEQTPFGELRKSFPSIAYPDGHHRVREFTAKAAGKP